MDINRELTTLLLEHRENQESHRDTRLENSFYHLIATGNRKEIEYMTMGDLNLHLFEEEGYGRLSEDSLRNIRYHYVITVAMITRYCVENGLPQEIAYTLSDLYINKMDKTDDVSEIMSLHRQLIREFTKKSAEQKAKTQNYSLKVVQAMDYIGKHLNEKLTTQSVAEAIDANRSYLSALFGSETGVSISDYIRNEKIKAACDLLRYSDHPYAVIAEYLCFSSQSHFTHCFHEKMDCTPAEYRKECRNQFKVFEN